MPAVLERCVRKVKAQGYPDSRAWAICSKSTGWKEAKGGGWKKWKKGNPHGKWQRHDGKLKKD